MSSTPRHPSWHRGWARWQSVLPDTRGTCYPWPAPPGAAHPGALAGAPHPRRAPATSTSSRLGRGSRRQHGGHAAQIRNPLSDRWVHPGRDCQDVGVITGEVAAVDRLMVSDPVTQPVEPGNPVVNVAPGLWPKMREAVAQVRRPQCLLVLTGQQEPPEAEAELGYHPARRLGPVEPSDAISSRLNILTGLLRKNPPRIVVPGTGKQPPIKLCARVEPTGGLHVGCEPLGRQVPSHTNARD